MTALLRVSGVMLNEEFPYWVNGILDDIRIYNRALTESETLSLYGKWRSKIESELL